MSCHCHASGSRFGHAVFTNVYGVFRLGGIVRFVAVLKPNGPRFDPGLAKSVYRTMLTITLAVDARIYTNVRNLRIGVFMSRGSFAHRCSIIS